MWALAAPYLSNGHLPAWLSCSSPFRAINRLALCGVREPHPEQYSSTVYRWWTRTFHGTWAVSATKITSKVKAKAVADVFKPASAIVKDILLEDLDDIPCPSLPRPEIIRRAANRRHQRLRPKDPQDLEFELATDHIPSEFLRADLRFWSWRHLVFATDQQLKFLARAKSWYIDATFKLCRRPFSQLMTVNAFIRKDDHIKQVPLLFMLMSERKKSDYCKVFKELIEILPSVPKVQQITLDFEKATWAALRKVLPHTNLHGCVFHWTQALWRKVR